MWHFKFSKTEKQQLTNHLSGKNAKQTNVVLYHFSWIFWGFELFIVIFTTNSFIVFLLVSVADIKMRHLLFGGTDVHQRTYSCPVDGPDNPCQSTAKTRIRCSHDKYSWMENVSTSSQRVNTACSGMRVTQDTSDYRSASWDLSGGLTCKIIVIAIVNRE